MPAPAPFQAVYPALYLYPLNDSFVPKHISLVHNQRVKIGRQTNAKTAPNERNGFFDSKVLSRQHAEVWEESNKIFIKDVKSSNGTFINGDRLSPESMESEPCELKSDDIVEFGIDIVGEDNKTIVHHKVAARIVCVFTEQDVQVAARAEQHQQQHQQFQSNSPGSSSAIQAGPSNGGGSASFNFSGQQRRSQMSQQGIAGMGGMGGSMRPPGKSGLTFDHILSRLQGELQKSRETGAELHTLTGAMNEINDTLGGALPPNLPPYPHTLPPVRSSQPPSQQPSAPPSNSGSPEQPSAAPSAAVATAALVDLQNQLQETQSSLTSHVDKIRALEGVLAEQEAIKREVRALREMMDMKRREREMEIEDEKARMLEDEPRGGFDPEEEEEEEGERRGGDDDDDDDARSISTIVPHELERVDEEDEEQLAAEEEEHGKYHSQQQEHTHEEAEDHHDREHEPEHIISEEVELDDAEEDEVSRRRRSDELGRPRTPEPTSLGMRDAAAYDSRHRSSALLTAPRRSSPTSPLSQIAASAASGNTSEDVIEQVMIQVGALMALTSSLEAQHTAAQSTISALESKVEALEATVKATQSAQAVLPPPPPPPQPQTSPSISEGESLTSMVNEWKKSMEGQWSSVREDWNKERERLNQAREEWEGKVRHMDSGLEKLASLQNAAAGFQQQQLQHHPLTNGDAMKHIGLVTPPSPRSLSSDSNRPRRRRSKSGNSRRGRSGQRSRSGSGSRDEVDTDTDTTLASEDAGSSPSKISSLSFASELNANAEGDDDGEEEEDTVLGVRSGAQPKERGARTLATPESSVYQLPPSAMETTAQDPSASVSKQAASRVDLHSLHMQTALGVLVLSVAAAAVLWRVKPET